MKRFVFLMSIVLSALLSLCLFSCGNHEPSDTSPSSSSTIEHLHSFDMQRWEINEEGHYNPCTCHPLIMNIKNHVDLIDRNGVCDVCGYVLVKADTYTVTIVDSEGTPVKGAEVVFRSNTDVRGKTDENGTLFAEFTDVGGVNLWLVSLPDGYEMPERDIYPFKGFELTITVEKQK